MNRRYRELKDMYMNRCFYCDSTINLEFAHRIPTKLNGKGRGKYDRIRDIFQNPNSYRLTCRLHNDFAMLFID